MEKPSETREGDGDPDRGTMKEVRAGTSVGLSLGLASGTSLPSVASLAVAEGLD